MWRSTLQALSPLFKFSTPADPAQLTLIEQTLDCQLPTDLRSLLIESDGLRGEYSTTVVWGSARIATDNQKFRSEPSFRSLYMPFDHLLFFGDAGNGDQFAFAVLDGEIRSSDVYRWDHENDSRHWVAPSLRRYLEWFLAGKLKL